MRRLDVGIRTLLQVFVGDRSWIVYGRSSRNFKRSRARWIDVCYSKYFQAEVDWCIVAIQAIACSRGRSRSSGVESMV